MSDSYDWDTAYKNHSFEHWEFNYPSPELSALVATGSFKKNCKMLDVGCGGGLDAIFLAQSRFNVIGVDISPTALKIAKRRAKKANVKVDWRLGNILDLPVENESIDFVTDRGLFHVVEDKNRQTYSSEVHRVLKLHGRLLIRGASKESSTGDRFNPVTEEAMKKYFSSTFKIGPVLPLPLFSTVGVMDGRIVVLRKTK
ncbi:MAG TPA: class I SAM-dependent methyltransferase [Candidatus Nanoarchaeia archaeon]|nr:class I SAM-dependent methyltransferase [Candidatus Nanoarchaeia archaeon]